MTTAQYPGALTRACVQALAGWTAPDSAQERLRRRYLDHLRRRPDGWARECPGQHLTASGLICAGRERQVLLVLHAKIGRWLQTGGHLEASDRSLASAALREAGEESGLAGLHIEPHPLLLSRHQVSCRGRPTMHLDVQHLVRAAAVRAPVVSAESLDVSWFAWDRLPEVDDSVADLVAAAAVRLGW